MDKLFQEWEKGSTLPKRLKKLLGLLKNVGFVSIPFIKMRMEQKGKFGVHCHITGKDRVAAHTPCNSNAKQSFSSFIPIGMHNMSGYDLHFFNQIVFQKKPLVLFNVTQILIKDVSFDFRTIEIFWKLTFMNMSHDTTFKFYSNLKNFEMKQKYLLKK